MMQKQERDELIRQNQLRQARIARNIKKLEEAIADWQCAKSQADDTDTKGYECDQSEVSDVVDAYRNVAPESLNFDRLRVDIQHAFGIEITDQDRIRVDWEDAGTSGPDGGLFGSSSQAVPEPGEMLKTQKNKRHKSKRVYLF
jgi:hypothetical protein